MHATDFIVDFLGKLRRPAPTEEIRTALRKQGIFIKNSSLNWTLTNLNSAGRIRRVSRGVYEATTILPPLEPEQGPGPQYLLRNGKLSEIGSPPEEDEARSNSPLHNRLRDDADRLSKNLQRTANLYPELANATREYSRLLDVDISDIDVTGLWSVGSSLVSFAQAYREQNIARTVSEPLEPPLAAMLDNVARQHGAFIMGFKLGRELVQRADEFLVDVNRLMEIERSGAGALNELTENRDLVDEQTRELHRPIRDSVVELGWSGSRVGYSAYLIVRNCVRTIIKVAFGNNLSVGTALSSIVGVSVLAGDPNAEFIRAAIPFLQHHGSQLLAFFNHSPEMRAYLEWALRLLESDRTTRPSSSALPSSKN